jgi:uroporphyrinogen III methyltransferase/synthase
MSWFDKRTLFGQRILVTRPELQSETLRGCLEELGANVLLQPAIEIGPPADWGSVDQTLGRLSQFDWLVFSSANGVRYLLERLLASGRDLRSLSAVRLAAIGPGTAAELSGYRLNVDLVPAEYRAESLAEALASEAPGKRFLLARASRGREVLAEQLTADGGVVEQIVVYRSTDCPEPDAEVASALASGQIDYTTVTSSAIARSLARLFGSDLGKSRLASISPITSDTLRQCGFEPAVEATSYTTQGIVDAILRDVKERPQARA